MVKRLVSIVKKMTHIINQIVKKNRIGIIVYLSMLFVLLISHEPGYAKETITWLTWEQVPNFIFEGKYKGQGIADTFTAELQKNLPQYNHQNLKSNTRRYWRLIKKEKVCVAWAWIVPGSTEYRIHSRSVSLVAPMGIQTLKSKQSIFGKPGQTLSLARLLENPEIKLCILKDMAYSKKVHDLTDRYKSKSNLLLSSTSGVEIPLKMLDRGRVDYFIGMPYQAIAEALMNNEPNKYQFYNIEEMNIYTSMYTHCSKTPFGEKLMRQINQIITDEFLMEHLAVVEKWSGENKQYREVFMDYVINRKPNAMVRHPGE